MEIFRLFGSILVNNDEANASIDKTDKKAVGVAEKFSNGIKTAAKWGAGIVTAAGTAGAGLIALADKTAESAKEIDNMSKRSGIAAKTLQEWKYAASQTGIEFDAFNDGVENLAGVIGDVLDGSEDKVKIFSDLGISVNDANGKLRNSGDIYRDLIMKLADMDDKTQRNVIGSKLFGDSFLKLTPFLDQGSKGINELSNKANELGLVMSDSGIKANVQFGNSMSTVKEKAGAVISQIGTELLPIVQQMLNWVMTNMPTIQAVGETTFNFLGKAIKFVIDNSDWLIPVLGGLLGAILALNVISTVTGLINAWKASTFATTLAQQGLNAVLKANPIGLVVTAIGLLVTAGVLLYKNWDTVKAKAMDVFGAIKNFISPIVEGIENAFKSMVNGVIKGLNFMIRGLNKLHFDVPDWVPLIGGGSFGFNIREIPSFAVGTRYLPKDMLIQAHEGEMIVPKSENPYANSGGSILGKAQIHIENMIVQDKGDEERNLAQLQFLAAL
jgi:hypothetical protein